MSLEVKIRNTDSSHIVATLTKLGDTTKLKTKDKFINDNIFVEVLHNTEDATASTSDILSGLTAYIADGSKATGSMTNNGAVSSTISTLSGTYTIPQGYHNGSGIITASLPVYDYSYFIPADPPTNLHPSSFYTGSQITNGYTTPTGVTMTGESSGTAIGIYTATYTLNSGYAWSDGSTNPIEVELIITDYLCFTANEAGSTVLCFKEFEYSTDKVTWLTANTSEPITLTNVGDKIYLRNGNVGLWYSQPGTFILTGSIEASGNLMSIIDNNCIRTDIPDRTYYLYGLFQDLTALTKAPDILATTLYGSCYQKMFLGCTNLTAGCKLYCKNSNDSSWELSDMFRDCTNLTTIPNLPMTKLSPAIYSGMFNGCTSLIISDTLTEDAPYILKIPTNGTFDSASSTSRQNSVFTNCLGTRASDNITVVVGLSCTYYTLNPPL